MSKTCDLFIFAGESSADAHGAELINALNGAFSVTGVAGPRMRAAGVKPVMGMEAFQVMGFIDVLVKLPYLVRKFYQVRREILKAKPKCVLLIDYVDFNLRMAKSLRRAGYRGKIVQYVSPTVWAWRKKRADLMGKTHDLLLSILPFEAKYYKHTPLPVEYVGHPLIQKVEETTFNALDLPKERRIIGLFPGSRRKELERNLPRMLEAAKQLDDGKMHFPISIAHERFRPLMEKAIRKSGLSACELIAPERCYDLMRKCDLALATSGTVNLELALFEVPTIVNFAITRLDQFIGKNILRIRLPFYCLVNIILEREVFPELYGSNFTVNSMVEQSKYFLGSSEARKRCIQGCRAVKARLGNAKATENCAKAIFTLLRN